jgi:hypothetical protein
MAQTHLKSAPGSRAPFGEDETERRAAVAQARILERRPLENSRRGEQNAAAISITLST